MSRRSCKCCLLHSCGIKTLTDPWQEFPWPAKCFYCLCPCPVFGCEGKFSRANSGIWKHIYKLYVLYAAWHCFVLLRRAESVSHRELSVSSWLHNDRSDDACVHMCELACVCQSVWVCLTVFLDLCRTFCVRQWQNIMFNKPWKTRCIWKDERMG